MAISLSSKLPWELANNIWAASLNPLIANPLNNISIIKDFELRFGDNIINHKLGHEMNGWFLVDIQGLTNIYRSKPFNDKTLTLNSSNILGVICSIGVF